MITDSHSIPLRRGAVGISLSHYGFEPLNDYRGAPDLFNRTMKVSMANVADGLAASAVAAMGEGSESTPLALIQDAGFVTFTTGPAKRSRRKFSSFNVPLKQDLYYPFIGSVPWRTKNPKTGRLAKNNRK